MGGLGNRDGDEEEGREKEEWESSLCAWREVECEMPDTKEGYQDKNQQGNLTG